MKELVQTSNFDKYKKELKKFSESTPKEIALSKVEIDGGFLGLGNHKVTGNEFNELTSQVQNHLINNNKLQTKFIKEFGQVYQALEALDKEYIQAILLAIKSAEKANEDVKEAQRDIAQTIELQKKTILALKEFKEKIESFEHLKDIDDLWFRCEELEKLLIEVQNSEEEKNINISKKLNIAYGLAGGAVFLVLIEFVLLISGVL